MPKVRANDRTNKARKIKPALTPLAQESQLQSLAVDLAMQKLMDGSASSQLICLILKGAMEKDRLEKEKLEQENELLRAKTKAVESGQRIEELYERAMRAMRQYSGDGDYDDDSNI